MRDLLSWKIYLGRWGGVRVYLHAFFLLLAIISLHLSARADDPQLVWYAGASMLMLLASVLFHEFAHCFAARRMGCCADQVLLWPFGGLTPVNVAHDPQRELITTLAGPIANLLVCVTVIGVLVVRLSPTESGQLLLLLNPLNPPFGDRLDLNSYLMMAFWLNWMLVVVNGLPAPPLDGGQILRAVVWPSLGLRSATQFVSRAATITAIAALITAWLVRENYSFASVPLVILGFVLYFGTRTETETGGEGEADERMFDYDFSQGYTSLERAGEAAGTRPVGPLKGWLERRREDKARRQRELEELEERRVDGILARLHATGMDGLTPEERALLDRVSARYRSRPPS